MTSLIDFKNRDVVSVKNFSREELEFIFDVSKDVKHDVKKFHNKLNGKIVSLLFYEPSTRTKCSFETAAKILGCKTTGFSNPKTSSVFKGETLHDTIKMFESYSDCIVIRHPNMGSAKFAAEVSGKPVINGGSGSQEHPTQTMLDMFTIREEFGYVDSLNIGVLGDLKYGRTPSSLSYGLSNYDVKIFYIAPDILQIREEVRLFLKNRGIKFELLSKLDTIVEDLDVLYVTRIQKERFPDPNEYKKLAGIYKITTDTLKNVKDSFIILHPLPRVDEISPDVDKTKYARYFEQAENGKYVRIALLKLILS